MLLAALAGFVVGALAGALVTVWLRDRSRGAVSAPVAPAVPSAASSPAPAAPVSPVAPVAASEPDPEPAPPPPVAEPDPDADLKPVLEATRGVVSELEQRYQGTRAAGDGEAKKPRQPRRRS